MYLTSRKILITLIGFILLVAANNTYAVEEKYHPVIKRFIEDVKNRDTNSMSKYIAFPFKRKHPIPSIKSKEDLEKRFDELFDLTLTETIVTSDLGDDWGAVGWRGIMLNSGTVWVDYDGRLLAINYQSAAEKQRASDLITSQMSLLHESVKTFSTPILNWETSKFKLRVDDLGGRNYRYTSWGIDKQYSDKPDLILKNGELVFEGSGGNRYYLFKNGKYSYRLFISNIGTSSTPKGMLDVYKSDKRIFHDEVVKVVN